MKTLLHICFIALSATTFAQEIHFCLSYTVLGEPIRVSNSWNVNEDGGYFYILYKQPGTMDNGRFELVVNEEVNGQFTQISRHRIPTEIGKNWIAVYYKFLRGGDFRVTVLENEKPVAEEYLTITQRKPGTANAKKLKKDPRLLYSSTRVVACEAIKEGKPVNPSAVFSIPKNTNQVTFLILNDQSLGTEKLHIELYKKPTTLGGYSDFVESKRVMLEHNRDKTYFTLEFLEPGEYKVYIYDEDQVWINSGYVTINN